MLSGEDDDVKLQRASAALLLDLGQLIPRLLRRRSHDGTPGQIRQVVRDLDLYKAINLIEPFQEDPQLLDTHLKAFIPPLVITYLEAISDPKREDTKKGFVPLSYAICYILNTFCKVRGEKVIKGFLNNEPRSLELILNELESGRNFKQDDGLASHESLVRPWVERYVLLLWLSHLMLAPFPLDSMSGMQSSTETSAKLAIDIPSEAPGVTLRVLIVGIEYLRSASKERKAAAQLLVRLCIRPDMQKLGLLRSLTSWALTFFSRLSGDHVDIHQCLGVLSFLSGLVASGTNQEIGSFLATVYNICQKVFEHENLKTVKASAVARKLIIKILRNIVLHCLQAQSAYSSLDTTAVIEEVVALLLEALEDLDTPVRYGASKALSIITLKLDTDMVEEMVEAILGALMENVYWQGSQRNISGVSPLRWHGLTLTLSHLLYRKAVIPNSLPNVLNALLLSLSFEQRSATGGSIGTNVRDAACFGIWALSRRYSTQDLLAVGTRSIRAAEYRKNITVPQVLAIELLVAACLDPAGNIRRGSSAALQELIGRHPNTIEEGIALVQVVDFNAVGLRQKAMCNVAIKAASLRRMYWEALFDELLEWRGTGSLDADSRLFAAKAIGSLSKDQPAEVLGDMAEQICDRVRNLRPRQVEERQGLISALAALASVAGSLPESEALEASRRTLFPLWDFFGQDLKLEDRSITAKSLRPELTAASVCSFLGALSALTYRPHQKQPLVKLPTSEMRRVFSLCLTRHEESVLEAIIFATEPTMSLLAGYIDTGSMIDEWHSKLENEASYNGLRCSGHAIALASLWGSSFSYIVSGLLAPAYRDQIVNVLAFRCTVAVAIEARTIALRALGVLLTNSHRDSPRTSISLGSAEEKRIGQALHVALNDYTITERGDVGALVRLEALNTVSCAWAANALKDQDDEQGQQIYADVLRLSLEKLDKMRVRAAHLLHSGHDYDDASEDVSSTRYFTTVLTRLQSTVDPFIRGAICTGFVSAAGMASEVVVQNSRAALLAFLEILPKEDADIRTYTLLDFVNGMIGLLKQYLTEDRILLPLLEVTAFLFDMQIIQRLVTTSFSFRSLLSLTQKAHFQSTHVPKLHLALDMYRGLGCIPATRSDTLVKIASMLLHPFPKIRITAAETLWLLTREKRLKGQDWSLPPKALKPAVETIKASVMAVA